MPRDPIDDLLDDVDESALFRPSPPVGLQEPIPEATLDNLICLKGPCRNYLEVVQRFDSGNTKGSPGSNMKMLNRYCMVHKGGEPFELSDHCVFACNKWDPEDKTFVDARNLRRASWKEVHEANGRALDEENSDA